MTPSSTIRDAEYHEILASILKRFIRLVGAPAALRVARRTPDLVVDDEGNILDFDHDNPLVTITQLIDQYGVVFGEAAVALSRQAVRPINASQATLHHIGLASAPEEPIRLLLVDDAILFRESLTNLLEQQPDINIVGQAGSVQEALQAARTLKPELILMDFSLPDGTGLDATLAILAEMPQTKIVFLTVHEDDERLFSAIRVGARGYLFKNSHANELVKTLRGVARGEAGISRGLARRIIEELARTAPPLLVDIDVKTELSTRELDVVHQLAKGASNREIAAALFISENTVKNHIRNVLSKLHLRNRREIARYARAKGLASPFEPKP